MTRNLISLIALLLFSTVSFTQGIYNNGANIVVASGTKIYIEGNSAGGYLTSSSGKLDLKNTAELLVEGDWTNNNGVDNAITTTTTTGWVRFKGNSATAQTIGGTGATTFPYLELNNANGITLSNNAGPKGQLKLTAGVVTTGGNYLVHSSNVAADLISYSNTAFINGNYRRYFTTNSIYPLPVGNGTATTNYFRADMITTATIAGATYVDASVATVTEAGLLVDANVATSENGSAISDVKAEQAEWTISPDAGSATYGVNLYVANISGLTDDKFTVVKRSTASTTYADWDTFDATTVIPIAGAAGRIQSAGAGYAQKTGFTSFSRFAIGLSIEVLPVELSSFKASCNEKLVQIDWETMTEINVSHFSIEKSDNGYDFYEIGQVDAIGNSSEVQNYSLIDEQPNNKAQYYRLISVDFDGSEKTSELIYQNVCNQVNESIKIKNIGNNGVALTTGLAENEKFNLKMVDALGRTVFSEKGNAVEGTTTNYFYYENLATGIYLVTYVGDRGNVHTTKIFVH